MSETQKKYCLVGTAKHSKDRLVIVEFNTEEEAEKYWQEKKDELDTYWKNIKVAPQPFKEKRYAKPKLNS